ncbi:hypothetical protein MMC12_006021 [Toensbergia leucococca]|nr:hypothetical protein [Toensbergia leucococca]
MSDEDEFNKENLNANKSDEEKPFELDVGRCPYCGQALTQDEFSVWGELHCNSCGRDSWHGLGERDVEGFFESGEEDSFKEYLNDCDLCGGDCQADEFMDGLFQCKSCGSESFVGPGEKGVPVRFYAGVGILACRPKIATAEDDRNEGEVSEDVMEVDD